LVLRHTGTHRRLCPSSSIAEWLTTLMEPFSRTRFLTLLGSDQVQSTGAAIKAI
jgi:hypothetical protein